jgi:hypothetical protein
MSSRVARRTAVPATIFGLERPMSSRVARHTAAPTTIPGGIRR